MVGLEALKLLNAQSTFRSERAGKSHNPLTAQDVAGAIAGTGMNQERFAYLKYAMDRSVQPVIVYSLYQQVVDLANEQGWKVPKGKELLRSMTQLAIVEAVHPMACTNCGGTGEVLRDRYRTCRGCHGTGRRYPRDVDRARAVGLDPSNWSRMWGERYESVYRIVRDWEADLRRALNKQLLDI